LHIHNSQTLILRLIFSISSILSHHLLITFMTSLFVSISLMGYIIGYGCTKIIMGYIGYGCTKIIFLWRAYQIMGWRRSHSLLRSEFFLINIYKVQIYMGNLEWENS